ncbi:MAG: hypothetical protein IK048_03260 [Clostridia bacterium]|nr:hypothetical protein [Clostridia bacterium]
MKKRLLLICATMLVVVLAFFAFVACDKTNEQDLTAAASGLTFEIILAIFTVFAFCFVYYKLATMYARNNVFVNFDNTPSNDKAEPLVSKKKASSAKSGKKNVSSGSFFGNTFVVLAGLLLVTVLVRLVLILTTYGVGGSTSSILHVASVLKEQGITDFVAYYSNTVYIAPGTLYILNIIGATGLDEKSASILLRFVNVFADMATVSLVYFYGKKYVGNRISTLFAGLYAVLPIAMYFGGIHYLFESVLVALMLGAVVMLVEKKYLTTYLLLALATVLDVRAMLLMPIALTYMGYMYYRDNESMKKFTANRAKIVFGLLGFAVVIYLLSLPVAINQVAAGDPFFGFKYMAGKIMTNEIFVTDSFNLYAMVGMNLKSLSNESVKYLNLAFILVLEIFGATMYFKNRNRQEILLLVSCVLAVVAVFTLKTDWTYLFLAIVFALVYAMVSGEKRVFFVVGAYSLIGFLNIAQLLYIGDAFANDANMNIVNFAEKDAFLITFSVIAVLLTGYFVYVVYSITTNGKIVDIKAIEGSFKDNLKNMLKRKPKKTK